MKWGERKTNIKRKTMLCNENNVKQNSSNAVSYVMYCKGCQRMRLVMRICYLVKFSGEAVNSVASM